MKRVLTGILGMILAGCATPGELLQRPDVEVLKSTREARAVAGCIGQKWSEYVMLGLPSTTLTEKGYLVALGNSGTYCVAGVEPEGTGSKVRFGQDGGPGRSNPYKDLLSCL